MNICLEDSSMSSLSTLHVECIYYLDYFRCVIFMSVHLGLSNGCEKGR